MTDNVVDLMYARHALAYGDEHDANCPLCGVDADPICDICNRSRSNSPNILPKMREFEADWDGYTGNHKTCQEQEDHAVDHGISYKGY